MRTLRNLLALASFLALSSAVSHATVAFFTGTEQQRTGNYTNGMGHLSNGTHTYSGRIYFLYELETGRSVEVRVADSRYLVRPEFNLANVATPRVSSFATTTVLDTILSDGQHTSTATSSNVSMIAWIGSKTIGAHTPDTDPATGLPSTFPRTFTSREDFSSVTTDDDGSGYHTHRNSAVSLMVGATKTSNLAGESFETALQRLKTLLDTQGRTEVATFNSWID